MQNMQQIMGIWQNMLYICGIYANFCICADAAYFRMCDFENAIICGTICDVQDFAKYEIACLHSIPIEQCLFYHVWLLRCIKPHVLAVLDISYIVSTALWI